MYFHPIFRQPSSQHQSWSEFTPPGFRGRLKRPFKFSLRKGAIGIFRVGGNVVIIQHRARWRRFLLEKEQVPEEKEIARMREEIGRERLSPESSDSDKLRPREGLTGLNWTGRGAMAFEKVKILTWSSGQRRTDLFPGIRPVQLSSQMASVGLFVHLWLFTSFWFCFYMNAKCKAAVRSVLKRADLDLKTLTTTTS